MVQKCVMFSFCLLLLFVSCTYEERTDTIKSFRENKEKYYRIVKLVKEGQYYYNEVKGTHHFGKDIDLTFYSFRVNYDPFYIQFQPIEGHAVIPIICFTETREGYEKLFRGNPHVISLDFNWYLKLL